jgi:hypothetical protein
VDAVVTTCTEESPVFLGDAARVHWSPPDPATATGDDDTAGCFRATLDDSSGGSSLFEGA